MTDDEQQIRQLVADWLEATKKGDLSTVLGLMAEDVVFLVPGQPPMIGRAGFEAATKAQTTPASTRPRFEGTSEIQEIHVFDDWAYLWQRLRVTTFPPDGSAPIARAGHTLSIFRKQAGKWLLARDANMLAPEKS